MARQDKSDKTSTSESFLKLSQDILVREGLDGHPFAMSNWARFLVACGNAARTVQTGDGRCVLVLLLPTREFAAVFTALGIILGSLRCTREKLTWQQLLLLPEDTKLFIQLVAKGKRLSLQGVIKEVGEEDFGPYRKIRITEGPKNRRGSIQYVVERNFSDLAVSLTEHPKLRDRRSIMRAGEFLKAVSSDFQHNWMAASDLEGLVVTTRAQWERITHALYVSPWSSNTSTQLADVLLASDSASHGTSRIALASVGKDVSSIEAPVAVLDGRRALVQWREIVTKNAIILLDSKEFDEETENALFDIAAARDDALLPDAFRTISGQAPRGIGLSAFATRVL